MRFIVATAAIISLAGMSACGPREESTAGAAGTDVMRESLEGAWRAALDSPGGEIPFMLEFAARAEGGIAAIVRNGEEEVPVPRVEREGDRVVLGFDHYDSAVTATLAPDGSRLDGEWTKVHHEGRIVRLAFRATRAEPDTRRFGPPGSPGSGAVVDVAGEWDVSFHEETRIFPARAIIRRAETPVEEGDDTAPPLMGTFVTPEGDYRYLAGDWRDGVLRLSGFDGAHAFLVVAAAQDDGTLRGDIWSRNTYHAPFIARRAQGDSPLPDPFAMTTAVNPERRLRFAFPDTDGRIVSSDDPRFEGKVVLVQVFGSWCPNCNDEAPLLVDLHRRYAARGLEVVGLAFELTGDAERDAVFVRRFADRHGIPWSLLLAGTSDKAEASKVLTDLSGILSFPTLVFVGRDGIVRSIYTGFSGPGTGEHFARIGDAFTSRIEALLEEPVPEG